MIAFLSAIPGVCLMNSVAMSKFDKLEKIDTKGI